MNDYTEAVEQFLSFIHRINFAQFPVVSDKNKSYGVVITPWVLTAIPFFATTLALMVRFQGHAVTMIWDDLAVQADDQLTQIENAAIERVLSLLLSRLPELHLVRVSEFDESPLEAVDHQEMATLAKLNAFWQFKTTVSSDELQQYQKTCAQKFARVLPKIKSLFAMVPLEAVFVPGGVHGNSGLFHWAGVRAGSRVTTYDTGIGILVMGVDGVAGHMLDVPKSLKDSFFVDPNNQEKAIALARYEFERRLEGQDELGFQPIAFSSTLQTGPTWDVLMPLNVDYDTAALGQPGLFVSAFEWVTETVSFVLNQTQASIAVRQHPGERLVGVNYQMELELLQRFGHHPRFRFIPAEEVVNTYRLLESARVVLPFTSTIGLEAAMLGKTVIAAWESYYAALSFTVQAHSRAEYFEKLKTYVQQPLTLSREQINLAWLCYYLQARSYIKTVLTGEFREFSSWVQWNFEELMQESAVQMVIRAFIEAVPLAVSNGKATLEAEFAVLKKQVPDLNDLNTYFENLTQAFKLKDQRFNARLGIQHLNRGVAQEALHLFGTADSSQGFEAGYYEAIALARLNRPQDALQILEAFLVNCPAHSKAILLKQELANLVN